MKKLEGMSCRRRLALLCDYLDGELPPSAKRVIAAHRRSCLPCGQVLASLATGPRPRPSICFSLRSEPARGSSF